MNLLDVALLYALVGAGCAVVVYRRSAGSPAARIGSAAITLPLWPLWAPVALIADSPPDSPASDRAARIEEELDQAVQAAAGSGFAILLKPSAAARIRDEVRAVVRRIAELDEALRQPGFSLDEAEQRVSALTTSGSRRAVETAVLHRNNVARIRAVRDRHERALEELHELVGALRSQLVLARFAGSSPSGVGGIVSELWARVEGLTEAMDAYGEVDASDHPDAGGRAST